MKRILLPLLIGALLSGSANAASPVTINNAANTASAGVTGTSLNVNVTGSSGTSSVNVAQVNGATVNVGTGAAGTGTQRVTTSTDSSTNALQSGTWTVQPGNTANTTAWKVDGSAVTQPVSATSLPLPTSAATDASLIAPQAPTAPATATATKSLLAGCTYTSAGVAFTNGQQGSLSCGANGGLYVSGGIASGAADSGNPVKIGGVYNSTLPTFTTGQRGDVQISSRGEAFSWMVVQSSTASDGLSNSVGWATATGNTSSTRPLVTAAVAFNGTTWDRQRSVANGTDTAGTGISAAGLLGQCDDTSPVAVTENQFGNVRINCTTHELKVQADQGISASATYSASITGLAPAAAATDIFTIIGSSTKTIRITRIQISGVATAASAVDVLLIKRSTADTAGTSSAPTVVPNDSSDAAGTAVVAAYTANPTLGTAVGTVRSQKITLTTAAGAIPIVQTLFDMGTNGGKPLTLRGVAQQLALNWNAQTVTGNSVNVDVEWIEE